MRTGLVVLFGLLLVSGPWLATTGASAPMTVEIEAASGPHAPHTSITVKVRVRDDAGQPVSGITVDLAPFGLRAATNGEGDAYFGIASGDVGAIRITASTGASAATMNVLWSRPKVELPSSLAGTVGAPLLFEARLGWAHDNSAIAGAAGGLFEGSTLVESGITAEDGRLLLNLEASEPGKHTYLFVFDAPWLAPARGTVNVSWSLPPASWPAAEPEPSPPPPSPPASEPPAEPEPEPEVVSASAQAETAASGGTVSEEAPVGPAPVDPNATLVRDVSADLENTKLVRLERQLRLEVSGEADVLVEEEVRPAQPVSGPRGDSGSVTLGRANEGWTLIRASVNASRREITGVQGAASWWIENDEIFVLATDGSEVIVVFAPEATPPALESTSVDPQGPTAPVLRIIDRGYGVSWAKLTLLFLLVLPPARRRLAR